MTSTALISVSHDHLASLRAWVELGKPRVTSLVLLSASVGAALAPGSGNVWRALTVLSGTALVVVGANTLNMYLERDTDAAMERTRHRPLPSGRLAPSVALWSGIGVASSGVLALGALVDVLTAGLAAFALGSYVLAYTPLKRVTPWALHVGAVPGALPPVIGWAGMGGALDYRAASLFLLLYAWQIPHFLAIAVFRETEYRRAGLAVMPAIRGLRATKNAIVLGSALLLGASAIPAFTGLGGAVYLVVALVLGMLLVALSVAGLRPEAGRDWARGVFIASLPYLVLVLGTLLANPGA